MFSIKLNVGDRILTFTSDSFYSWIFFKISSIADQNTLLQQYVVYMLYSIVVIPVYFSSETEFSKAKRCKTSNIIQERPTDPKLTHIYTWISAFNGQLLRDQPVSELCIFWIIIPLRKETKQFYYFGKKNA